MNKEKIQKLIYRWRVRVGLFCMIPVLILSKPNFYYFMAGIIISSIGLLIRIWASGYIMKEKKLTICGPYQYTRNPLYLGNLFLIAGIVCLSHSYWILLCFILYIALFYPVIIHYENQRMERLFPHEFSKYKKNIPSLFPKLKPYSSSCQTNFSRDLFMKNKEYRASLGMILLWLLIYLKMVFFG
ncbi:MAG: methyltransferase family protein [Candidatus Aminicenantaceae bacterium]